MHNLKIQFNLNKKVCTSILEHFAYTFSLEMISASKLRPYVVLEVDNETYIIARKYKKLANNLIDYYEQGKKYHLIIPATIYLALQTFSLTSQVDANWLISFLHLKDPYAIEVSKDDYTPIDVQGTKKVNAKFVEVNDPILDYTESMGAIYESKIRDMKIEKYNLFLTQYSNYFHLDSNKVIDMAKQLTNNYQESFSNVLSEKTMEEYDLYNVIDNPETASLLFSYFVYRNIIGNEGELVFKISDFGYSKNEIISTTEIETVDYDYQNGEELVLENGLTRSQFTGKICDLLKMDKYYTLAISYSETGVDGCPVSRNYNNYGGMKNKNGEPMKFPTAYAGLASQALNLKTYPVRYNVDSLEKLWQVYAEKGEDWLRNVNHFYNLISSNPSLYFIDTSNLIDYQNTFSNTEDSLAWDQSDLSYTPDHTITYNIGEESAILIKKI